jgi:7-dehydrocholesterol reductase
MARPPRRSSVSAPAPAPAPAPPRRRPSTAAPPPAADPWGGESFASPLERLVRLTLGPLLLMLATPILVNVAALCALRFDSSFAAMLAHYGGGGSGGGIGIGALRSLRADELLRDAFPLPAAALALLVAGFVLFELALLVLLPGGDFAGALAPSGFVPRFRRNGGLAFAATAAAFLFGARAASPPWFAAEVVYDQLLPLMTLLNGAALALAAALFAKGVLAPSTADHGHGAAVAAAPLGGILFRVYWGEELYPSLLGVDLKQLLISRCGMMSWFVFTLSLSFAAVREGGGAVTPALFASAALNLLYVAKFFVLFEPEYMRAADIAVDRLGFMLAWGPLCFMPLVHNLQTLHLVRGTTALPLSWPVAAAWVAAGAALVLVNFDADTQRHRVRAQGAKGGAVSVWGRPATFIRAAYRDAAGGRHESLLLTCGYHGLVRHFHYLPDIALLALYCGPAALPWERPLAWSYFVYLTSLLVDRCQRIDARCEAKYGDAWRAYVRQVPYKLIPGVF